MISSMANHYWSFYRQTAFAMDRATATATMAITRALAVASYAQIKVVGGTTGSGSVTVIGTDSSGSALSNTLTFTKSSTQVTPVRFTTITSITTSGLADEVLVATVECKAVSSDGTENLMQYLVAANRPVLVEVKGTSDNPVLNSGSYAKEMVKTCLDYESSWTPKISDIAIDDQTGDQWLLRASHVTNVGFGLKSGHHVIRCTLL